MPPKKSKSRKSKKEVQDAENANSESNPTNNNQSRRRSGDISTSTTNEPSSASATAATSIAEARHPTSLSETLPVATAATSAAPKVPLSGKKPHKAGFKEQFLQKLRVMLDRESQNDDAAVHWSKDGNSFIVSDQTQFEEEIIPKYFGNSIVFASFLRKLQRWGFVRLSSIRSGRYEFSSPTFKRMDSESTPAAATGDAATTANTFGNDGGGASIPLPLQQQQQQVTAQPNQQLTMPVHDQLPRQAAASSAIADLISNIQSSRTQQPSTSSQQPGPNQHTNQTNLADINNILQNIIGSNQHQPIASQNSLPNQQPVPTPASQMNNVAGINHLQSFPQWQHPNNSTMNLLNAALQSLGRGPTPPAQAMGQYPPPSAQSNTGHTLMSLAGMLPQSPPPNTTPVASQSNNMEPLLLLMLALKKFVEEEHQRRSQADALHEGIIGTIGHIVGQNNVFAEAGRQTFGRAGEINMHQRNPTGMTVRVPNNSNTQPNQEGAPPPVAVDNNIPADSITAILQPAPRGYAPGQPDENARAQNNDPVFNTGSADDNDEGKDGEPLSPRNRKSSDSYEADDVNRDKRLRKRKKSHTK